MPPLPAWLVAHLEDTGALTGRAARHTRCTSCRRPVLSGIDGDRCGALAICDPTEIDANGELVAFALGLRTYTLTRARTSAGRAVWNLDPRHPWAIAAGITRPVVAQHRCGVAIPPAPRSLIPTWMTPQTTDHPNF